MNNVKQAFVTTYGKEENDQFSAILKAKFGRNPYFERRMGKRPMPPAEQALVLQVLATVGIKEPLDFYGFKEDILW